jgi:enoyl-CoA hydratase/carnithine racemase
MSGQQMRGARVLELGLADELTTPEELESMTYEFAELVCSRAQFSVRSAKTIVGRVLAGQVTDDEFTTELRNSSFDTDDYAEGVRAFLGKRAPSFTWS